jgi:hypothetical protein
VLVLVTLNNPSNTDKQQFDISKVRETAVLRKSRMYLTSLYERSIYSSNDEARPLMGVSMSSMVVGKRPRNLDGQ